MKYFSAFSGIGGFDEAIKQVMPDAENVGYSEIDKYAVKIYEKHNPEAINFGDIRRIDEDLSEWYYGIRPTRRGARRLPDFDLITSGSPCQDFSIAGKRAGLEGTRSGLIYEVFRLIREKQPRTVLLENVAGILSSNQGWDFAEILCEMDGAGYDCEWELINTKRFLPQNRLRLFLIGHSRRESWKPVFPLTETNGVHFKSQKEIANCLDANYAKGWLDHGQRTMIQVAGKSQANRVYSPGGIASTLRNGEGQGAKTGLYIISDSGQGRKCQMRSDTVAPLRANNGAGHNNKIVLNTSIRRLTPTEAERLRGFPDGFTAIGSDGKAIFDSQRYKCLGNAVSVPVVAAIIQKMVETGAIY